MRSVVTWARRLPSVLVIALAAVVTVTIPAWTGDSAVGSSLAGDGEGDVSGFTVSDIDYHLAADPGRLESVTFRLDPAPNPDGSVRVVLADHTYDCAIDGAVATCHTADPPLTVADITSFRVIAAD